MKRPTQETLVQHWNIAYPSGTPVMVRETDGSESRTVTRSTAWLAGAHTAVVHVEGRTLGVELERVRAIP